ncbi:MAG: arylsulfatase [Pseudomonadota bacterium]|nr:arylsulfatase [Pseudomonadota bacterium]
MTLDPDFRGVAARNYSQSKEHWGEAEATLPENAPDIIFILMDDVGYSDIGCYGSEIDTPNMDRLAELGTHYTNFHVTAMCSPTRASLLTGRNSHSAGMGVISDWAAGFPGYRGMVNPRAGTVAEILKGNGYNTFAVGKWHLTPMKEIGAAGPFHNWPLGKGFEKWYGFQGAYTNQWNPELYRDNNTVETPDRPDYHLSEDMIDNAITYIDNQKASAPDRPFFLYVAFGAAHWPHHVPQDLIDKYKGRYDAGWDVTRKARYEKQLASGLIPANTELPPPNPGVPEWSSLDDDERAFAIRGQEVYAGFVEHTDQQIGRLVDFLEARGRLDNTLIVLMSDNGASPEGGPVGTISLNPRKHMYHEGESAEERAEALGKLGGPETYPHYAYGWAQASNTPLRWYKMNTYGGGVRSPLITHWPATIAGGRRLEQYHHVIDLVPTVLDILDIEAPEAIAGVEQMPMQGISMRYSFTQDDTPSPKETQFFELAGDRAIWHKGWKAVTRHPHGKSFDEDKWELFKLDEDFSEAHDLSDQHPEKLKELVDLWWNEAEATGALPLDDKWAARSVRAPGAKFRTSFTFYPGLDGIDRIMAPDLFRRSYRIEADVEIAEGATDGVLLAFGTSLAGYSFYVKDGYLAHQFNFSEAEIHKVLSDVQVTAGRHTLAYDFTANEDGGGTGRLEIDGKVVGVGEVRKIWPIRAVQGPLTCGRDVGLTVSKDYSRPFAFASTLHAVTVELGEEMPADPNATVAGWPPPHMK